MTSSPERMTSPSTGMTSSCCGDDVIFQGDSGRAGPEVLRKTARGIEHHPTPLPRRTHRVGHRSASVAGATAHPRRSGGRAHAPHRREHTQEARLAAPVVAARRAIPPGGAPRRLLETRGPVPEGFAARRLRRTAVGPGGAEGIAGIAEAHGHRGHAVATEVGSDRAAGTRTTTPSLVAARGVVTLATELEASRGRTQTGKTLTAIGGSHARITPPPTASHATHRHLEKRARVEVAPLPRRTARARHEVATRTEGVAARARSTVRRSAIDGRKVGPGSIHRCNVPHALCHRNVRRGHRRGIATGEGGHRNGSHEHAHTHRAKTLPEARGHPTRPQRSVLDTSHGAPALGRSKAHLARAPRP